MDLPKIEFDTMDSATPLNVMQRVTMGYDAGLLTLNQSLNMLNLPPAKDGDKRKDIESPKPTALPRENSQDGASDVAQD